MRGLLALPPRPIASCAFFLPLGLLSKAVFSGEMSTAIQLGQHILADAR